MSTTPHAYQWLQDIVRHLDPSKIQPYPMLNKQTEGIIFAIQGAKRPIQEALNEAKLQCVHQAGEEQLVRQYYNAAAELLEQTTHLRELEQFKGSNTRSAIEAAETLLKELMDWMQVMYRPDQEHGQLYTRFQLKPIRDAIAISKLTIQETLLRVGNDEKLVKLLIQVLDQFMEQVDQGDPITKRQAEYHQYLLNDIQENYLQQKEESSPPPLFHLIVDWNLNAPTIIPYYKQVYEKELNSLPKADQKLSFAAEQLKQVKNLPNPSRAYVASSPALKDTFIDYFSVEIEFLEHLLKLSPAVPVLEVKKTRNVPIPDELKVLTNLSVDQIAIIFRAAKDAEVLIARSFDDLFETLAPYVTSKDRTNISWRSMRSKAFSVEQRDKVVVINVLKEIIRRIEGY